MVGVETMVTFVCPFAPHLSHSLYVFIFFLTSHGTRGNSVTWMQRVATACHQYVVFFVFKVFGG